MTATHSECTTKPAGLYLAFELSWSEWKLAFTIGHGQSPRLRSLRPRDLDKLHLEIAKAKKRFGLPDDAPLCSCYEAGRDGFWLHRYLTAHGVHNCVVDSASIEVNRRKRRAKSDRLDAVKLVSMLLRFHGGESKVWSVVRVPSVTDEDARQLHRELEELKDERTGHVNRLKGLLASQGLSLVQVDQDFPAWLQAARLWDGSALGADLYQRLLREYQRWQLAGRQIKELEKERLQRIRCAQTPHVEQVRQLLQLWGVGVNGAWLLVYELFAWRHFANRKQVGSIIGMTPTPYQSGDSSGEQGISKAGNRRLRRLLVELAWCWLRWQPDSTLSQWYQRRFAKGGRRARKIGVVAVARKLLIVLWRYLQRGEVPAGARLLPWKTKVKGVKVVQPAA
jgi:transposase